MTVKRDSIIRAKIPKNRPRHQPIAIHFDVSGSMGSFDSHHIFTKYMNEGFALFTGDSFFDDAEIVKWSSLKKKKSDQFKTDTIVFRKPFIESNPSSLWSPAISTISKEEDSSCKCCDHRVVYQYAIESASSSVGLLTPPSKTNVFIENKHNGQIQRSYKVDVNSLWSADTKIQTKWHAAPGKHIALKEPRITTTFASDIHAVVSHYLRGKLRLFESVNKDLVLHSANGPALAKYDDLGRPLLIQYCYNGKSDSLTGPAITEWNYRLRRRKEEWQFRGQRHRTSGPAVSYYQYEKLTAEEWYTDGRHNRVDGPAIVRYNELGQIDWADTEWHIDGYPYNGLGKAIANGTAAVLKYAKEYYDTHIVPLGGPIVARKIQFNLYDLLEKSGIITDHAKRALEAISLFSR